MVTDKIEMNSKSCLHVITSEECRNLVSIPVAIKSQRDAFAAFERREGVHVPERLRVPMSSVAGKGAVTLVKPASLNGHIAVKIVSVVPENAEVSFYIFSRNQS